MENESGGDVRRIANDEQMHMEEIRLETQRPTSEEIFVRGGIDDVEVVLLHAPIAPPSIIRSLRARMRTLVL